MKNNGFFFSLIDRSRAHHVDLMDKLFDLGDRVLTRLLDDVEESLDADVDLALADSRLGGRLFAAVEHSGIAFKEFVLLKLTLVLSKTEEGVRYLSHFDDMGGFRDVGHKHLTREQVGHADLLEQLAVGGGGDDEDTMVLGNLAVLVLYRRGGVAGEQDREGLKDGVGEALAKRDVLDQALDVVDNNKRALSLESIIENLVDHRALCRLVVCDQLVGGDKLDMKKILLLLLLLLFQSSFSFFLYLDKGKLPAFQALLGENRRDRGLSSTWVTVQKQGHQSGTSRVLCLLGVEHCVCLEFLKGYQAMKNLPFPSFPSLPQRRQSTRLHLRWHHRG